MLQLTHTNLIQFSFGYIQSVHVAVDMANFDFHLLRSLQVLSKTMKFKAPFQPGV